MSEQMYTKVFVSLDGSEEQEKVLDRAIAVAGRNNAELYIGHVIDITALEAAPTYSPELVVQIERAFRDSIDKQVKEAEESGKLAKVEVLIKMGRIRETLKDEMLDTIHPDLVMCGARGLSSIKYAIMGSISTFLVRSAHCDVLVVK